MAPDHNFPMSHHKSLALLIPLVFSLSLQAFDRLAADALSATYRTGAPDPKALAVPADIRNTVSKNPEQGLPLLVQYLTADTADGFLKVKRLHDWITDNIAYDSDLLLGLSDQGSRKVVDLVKFKRTTCGGYSGLFHQMASLAGLSVETIRGNSKTCWIKSSQRDCHHVWNAVNLNGKWYYVDTTADGRFTYKHGAFTPKKRYHDVYLFINPEAKLLINLPLEERQQFLTPPVSRAEYLRTPRVSVLYYKYAVSYAPETIARFREAKRDFEGGALQKVFDIADSPGEIFELRLKAPANLMLFPQIVQDPAESFDDSVDSDKQQSKEETVDLNARSFCFRESAEQVVCQYSPAKPGRYKAYISAKEAGDLHKFGLIHAFTLVAAKAGPVLPQTQGRLYTGPLFDHQGFSILAADFNPASPFASIEAAKPEGSFLTSFVFGMDGKQVPAAVEYSYLSRTRIKFYYKFAKPGTYWVRLQTRIPDEAEAPRQNVAVLRLTAGEAPQQKFPPQNEMIFTKLFAEENFSFTESNIAQGSGDVAVTVSGTAGRILECILYNAAGKPVAQSCSASGDGGNARFQFSIPGRGKFGGRIFLNDGGQKKILGYFKTER